MSGDSQVFRIAQNAARLRGDSFVDTGDLLLGIIENGPSVVSYLLGSYGVTSKSVRTELQNFSAQTPSRQFAGDLPYSPRLKTVTQESWQQARKLGCNKISEEHLLLALIAQHDGMAVIIFESLKVDVQALRAQILIAFELLEGQKNRLARRIS